MDEMTVVRERKRVMFATIDRLAAVHREWIDSDAMVITEAMGKAVMACEAVFSTGTIPGDCRPLTDRVLEMLDQWRKWDDDNKMSRHEILPGNGFWKTLRNVFDARKAAAPARKAKLESIAQLSREKVGDAQICRIYDWVEEDGTPQLWKVREERAKPGTHTSGPTAVDLRRQQAAEAERRETEAREKRLAEKVKAANEPAPEGLATLVEQGVSAGQIASMLKIDVDKVYRQCDELGLPLPPESYELPVANTASAAEDDDDVFGTMEVANSAPLTLEQSIIGWHKAGKKPAEIAELVSSEETPVNWQKALAIIKRYEQDPDAFELASPVES